ncbi:MAG: hypothetical protein R3F43_05990 [bacterium]
MQVRDWRFGQVTRPVGGVGHRAPFYAAYGEAAGRPVDPARVHFGVAGNLRWGRRGLAGGAPRRRGGRPGAVGDPRRAAEMEYEALRLIETGPTHHAENI